MRCIFCKRSDVLFTSVEHIIPESIGNTEHILPKGIVCDSCNNYFSRKVENEFINSDTLLEIRRRMEIPNKRGKIPTVIANDKLDMPGKRIIARFLCKVGLEALAHTAIKAQVPNWESVVIDKKELDTLRNFSRFNIFNGDWLFHYRTLHPVNAVSKDKNEYFEMLHEYDLLYTKDKEMYLVISIFGVEFAINMGGPYLDGYEKWLKENNFQSFLYSKKGFWLSVQIHSRFCVQAGARALACAALRLSSHFFNICLFDPIKSRSGCNLYPSWERS